MALDRIALLEQTFSGLKPIRFNRHTDKLYIDMNWETDISIGEFLIIDGYSVLDTGTYGDVWGDRWLMRYTTAIIKMICGPPIMPKNVKAISICVILKQMYRNI